MSSLSPTTHSFLLQAQQDELTESYIYRALVAKSKDTANTEILLRLARDEQAHHDVWKKYTGCDVTPNMNKVRLYSFIASWFGLSFGLKLMERGEQGAQNGYETLRLEIPEAAKIIADEETHEQALIGMINDKALTYMGSIVLGLNDALVELTGVLAGLTLGLQDPKLIAVVGLITGISASFSMGASEYLSTKAEGGENALTASFYTWIAYISTVVLLILPFLLVPNPFIALPITLVVAVSIIAAFNRYVSIAKEYNFRARFREMTGISLGVAVVSFGIGLLVRHIFGIGE